MKSIFTKIAIPVLILSFISPYVFPTKKAEAVFGVADTVIVVGDTSPTGISNNINHTMQHVKEFVLDGLANALMKQLAQQITNSIVNWINSGFDGSPAFVQNPSAFFLDVADQTTGEFISETGVLADLCSPFSIDLRIALSFKYHPSLQKRYACTLGTVISNSSNAIKNASINGFTAGDFRQGGWPAFVSLTTEPQNNIYGAYLSAESDLSYRVAQAQGQKQDQLAQGRGFLSWEKCKLVDAQNQTDDMVGDGNYTVKKKECHIETPGSVIAGSLDAHLSGPLRQLELANKINEIVNALFAQLASVVLQKGLGAVSGSGPSDSSSYINQIQQSITTGNENLQSIKTSFIKNVEVYLKNSLDYKTAKDSSLNYILDIKKKYNEAKACFIAKQNSGQRNGPDINSILQDIDQALVIITPLANRLFTEATQADKRYDSLLSIRDSVTAASTVTEVNQQGTDLTSLVQGESIITLEDVKAAKTEHSDIVSDYRKYLLEAERYIQRCTLSN